MKLPIQGHTTHVRGRAAPFLMSMATGLWMGMVAPSAQTIPNPSFETDTFTVFPGYIRDNAPITGWTGTPVERVGINPSDGSPFANNGVIPDGNQAAFIQANVDDPFNPSTLSTTLQGLTAGTAYTVSFRVNSRESSPANTPNLKVYVDGIPWLMPGIWWPEGLATRAVGGANPYHHVAFEFTASAVSQVLSLVNDAEGDHTLVVDDFRIAPASGRWEVGSWSGDADSGVDASFFYTHACNLGSGNNVVVNEVTFVGVPGAAPAVAGSFSTTHLGSGPVADAFNLVTGASAGLAAEFVYGGTVPGGSAQSITLSGLTPGMEYVATIYSVAWEDPSEESRWATFSVGEDRLTINQNLFGNDTGIRISHRYIADETGSQTLAFAPLIPANVSIHVYAFSNREATSRNVAPVLTAHPENTTVSPGLPVTFRAAGSGVPLPSYQWRFEGEPIAGATEATYTVAAVSSDNAGLYDVVLSNAAGSTTSNPARLTVGEIAIVNPSFEADVFTTWPGYVRDNWSITGWEALGGHGVNPVEDGSSPFADNGAIPHGVRVAFLQDAGELRQLLSGFTLGGDYYVHYHENARTVVTVPALEVRVGDTVVVPEHAVPPVGGGNPYRAVSSAMFEASAAELELSFIKSNPQGGDCTVLIDNVSIVRVPPGTPPSISQAPRPVTAYVGQSATFSAVAQGSLPLHYQWQLDGEPIEGAASPTLTVASIQLADEGDYTLMVSNDAGSVTSPVSRLSLLEPIPSLRNTGLDAAGAPQPAGAVSAFWTFVTNPDSGAEAVIVANDGWPIEAGVWMVNSAASKWVGPRATVGDADIAAGNYRYRTTFDLGGRDLDTVWIVGRWASDDGGVAVYLNDAPVTIPLSQAFTSWTSFTLTSDDAVFQEGLNSLDFEIVNGSPGPSGLRVEFTQTSARTVPGVPAAVVVQPQGARVAEGDTVVLQVGVTGTLPITYHWRRNGVDLPGATGESLTLTDVTPADSGRYTVAVSNPWGQAVSAEAIVVVAYQALPGFHGTGVAADGELLPDGAVDPHYRLVASDDWIHPGPDAIVVNDEWPIAPAGPWLANGPRSRWIAPRAEQNESADPTQGNPGGDYAYQTTFDLTGLDLEKIRVVGGVAVDNELTDVLLNGVSTGIVASGFGGLTSFTLTSGWVAGINTLEFLVHNAQGTNPTNPTGLRVDLAGYLDIAPPEPTVTLQIGRTGNTITLGWSPDAPGQTLQSAPTVFGPWTDIPDAPNPYTATATEAAAFYRVIE